MKRFLLIVLLLPFVALQSGCGLNVYPISKDIELGADIDAEIRANPQEYPILDNEMVRGYLQGLVDEIIRAPEVEYRGQFAYKVTVINDDRTLNAFATPGGYIYVYTGLLRYLENEAAIAGVLAHEIAHAEERHATDKMTADMGKGVLVSAAGLEEKSAIVQIAANSTDLLATLANSRADEAEADEMAFEYLEGTRFWPGGIKLFFERMILESGRGSSLFDTWLSTHPAPEDRVEAINKMLKERQTPPPTPEQLGLSRYRTMLRNLN